MRASRCSLRSRGLIAVVLSSRWSRRLARLGSSSRQLRCGESPRRFRHRVRVWFSAGQSPVRRDRRAMFQGRSCYFIVIASSSTRTDTEVFLSRATRINFDRVAEFTVSFNCTGLTRNFGRPARVRFGASFIWFISTPIKGTVKGF